MLNSITCDTELSEIISLNDISGYLEELEDISNNYTKKITETIVEEQSHSGLSVEAFSIDGKSYLKEDSNQLLENNSLGKETGILTEKIQEELQIQRTKEIQKLKEKVSEKLTQLNQEYNNILRIIDRLDNNNPDNVPIIQGYIEQADNLKKEIAKYSQKLQVVEGMR